MKLPQSSALCRATLLLLLGSQTSCAHGPEQLAAHDPGEPVNRTMFGGNVFVDGHVLRPVARTYANNVPGGVRRSIHSFVNNLGEPVVLINDLGQANFSRSWNTSKRFIINTTLGGLGLFDVASMWGMPYHDADFGQTFGVWGIPAGPEIQLPLLGFSNVRDTAGRVVGIIVNPATLASGSVIAVLDATKTGLGLVDGRARLLPVTDQVQKTALDPYATLRAMTEQNRAEFVREGIQGRVSPAKIRKPPAAAVSAKVVAEAEEPVPSRS